MANIPADAPKYFIFEIKNYCDTLRSLAVDLFYVDKNNLYMGFPGGSTGKESTCSMGDLGLIPGLGKSPGGGHGNPL